MTNFNCLKNSLCLDTVDYCLKNRQPWIVFNAIEFLNSLDFKGRHIFEYGSGGSTLFWLEKGAIVTSIEHDNKWFNLMEKYVEPYRQNIDIICIIPEEIHIKNIDYSDPINYASKIMKGYNFENYVTSIDIYLEDFFDIIFIDGRARPSCIMHSYKKVKKGGMLIIDDTIRNYYLQKTEKYLDRFNRKDFSGVKITDIRHILGIFSKMSVFFKT